MKRVNSAMQRCWVMLMALIFCVSAFAQTTVKGLVKDDLGEPLAGVKIAVKGGQAIGTTDLEGKFQINCERGTTLVFTYMGFHPREVVATANMLVVMSEDTKTLDEAVVIGYGSVKKNDMTGSVVAFRPDEKNKGMITSPQEMLQGKVAGVVVNTHSGEPGAGAMIRVRGGSSLNASNDPLIVIDGMAMDNNATKGMSNPLSLVNPNDIESFSILKDASATAIYGSRGSNGVILITTKKGRAGGPVKVSYNGSVSFSTNFNTLDVMNAQEYVDFITNYYGEGSKAWNLLGWKKRDADGNPLKEFGTYDTDWQKEIYRTGVNHDHNITLQGGVQAEDKSVFAMPYRVSVGYTGQQGVLKGSDYKRLTASVNLSPSFLDNHLTFNMNGKFVKSWTNPGNGEAIGAAVGMDPTQPIKDMENPKFKNYGGYFQWVQEAEYGNPNWGYTHQQGPKNAVELVNNYGFDKDAWVFMGNVDAAYKVHGLEDLSLHVNLAGEWTNGQENTYQSPYSMSGYYYGSYGWNTEEKHNLQLSAFAAYDKEFNKNHSLNVMAGYEWSEFQYMGREKFWGYYPEGDRKYNPDPAQNIYDPTGYPEDGKPWGNRLHMVSWFGRANYSLLDRYLFTFTARADGSSRFAKGNQWGFFPSAAFAWRINDEGFMKDVDEVSEMKLRLGWGKTGQQDFPGMYHYYLPAYSDNKSDAYTYPLGGTDGSMTKPDAYNADLRWETTTTYNFGLDMGFLNQRFTASVDAYLRKTTDLFNLNSVPTGSNFNNKVYSNVGSLTNRGVEFSFVARPIVTKDWYWEIGGNFGYNSNEIDELYGGRDMVEGGVWHANEAITYHKVGLPANSFYVYQQVYGENGQPLMGVYVDRNGDGVITDQDRYFYKSTTSPWTAGLSTRLQYKNWDLGMNFRGAFGGYVYNELESGMANIGQAYTQKGEGWLNNATADLVKMGWTSYVYGASDYFVQNASFVKCDNITLGYNFENLFKTQKYQGISGRLAFSVSNVFYITKYKGLDPEQTSGAESSLYPRPRTYMVNLNLNF